VLIVRGDQTSNQGGTTRTSGGMTAESMQDLDVAGRWLDKALYCFGQVGDTELARKARANRASLIVRKELERCLEKPDLDYTYARLELDAAEILERLLSDHLALKARKFMDLLLPLLGDYPSTRLRKQLLPLLPSPDDD
jgi:hypothetical protein